MTETEIFINILKDAVNGRPLSVQEPFDADRLWDFSVHHCVTPTIAGTLLESNRLTSEDQRQAWAEVMLKSVRKTVFFDTERELIYRTLEANRIWYVPLKGIVVNELYPVYGIRDFSDNDIWIDGTALDRLEAAMPALGYRLNPTDIAVHYTYYKQPLLSFEFHHRLFSDKEKYKLFNRYFDQVRQEMLSREHSGYAYRLSNEDNYIYLTVHAFKHYCRIGLGLKTAADVYLFRKHFSLDEQKLSRVFDELQIAPFVQTIEGLSQKLFDPSGVFLLSSLTEAERQMLDEILRLGSRGDLEEFYSRRFDDFVRQSGTASRMLYYKNRLFPSMEPFKKKYPTLYKHKALHPLFYVYRPIRGLVVNRKALKCELKTVVKSKKQQKKEVRRR